MAVDIGRSIDVARANLEGSDLLGSEVVPTEVPRTARTRSRPAT